MTTAPLSAPHRLRSAAGRAPAVVGAIAGNIVILGIVALAALVVPVAAALTFGSALLSRLG